MARSSPKRPKNEIDFEFWFDDRVKVFKVEKRLFRIPIHQLIEQSEFFNDMFNDATPAMDAENGQEGGSSRFPIVIPDETATAFTMLLKWVYKKETKSWTQADWLECVRVAHKFRVPSLTTAAMEFITKSQISPVKLIGLCATYQLAWSWARNAIAELCNQYRTLLTTTDDNLAIPPQLLLEIFVVRDMMWKRKIGESYPIFCNACRAPCRGPCGNCGENEMSLLPRNMMDMTLVDKIVENM
ncbi:hypothetical protein DL96DRAFT_1625287, partial [Flagelloscypha sp. PMI_526]